MALKTFGHLCCWLLRCFPQPLPQGGGIPGSADPVLISRQSEGPRDLTKPGVPVGPEGVPQGMQHQIPLLADLWCSCFLGAEEAEQLLPAQLTALRAPYQVSPEVRLMSGTGRAGLGSVDWPRHSTHTSRSPGMSKVWVLPRAPEVTASLGTKKGPLVLPGPERSWRCTL